MSEQIYGRISLYIGASMNSHLILYVGKKGKSTNEDYTQNNHKAQTLAQNP